MSENESDSLVGRKQHHPMGIRATTPADAVADRCGRAGWVIVPWALLILVSTIVGILVWIMVAVVPDIKAAARNANAITSAVNQRTEAYLTQTDGLMQFVTPANVAVAGTAILPYVGDAISKLSASAGAEVNLTKLAFALEDLVDMFAATATNTRRNGLVITVLQPDPTVATASTERRRTHA